MKLKGISKDCRLALNSENQKRLARVLKKLDGENLTITIEKQEKARSVDQNALYWRIIKQVEEQKDQDKESIHEFIKSKFLWEPVEGKPFPIIRSTTSLSTIEFKTLIDKMVSFFTVDMDCEIRMPEDQ